MSYKFQVGKAILSGALDQEAGDLQLLNHSGDKKVKLKTDGTVSGSGNFEVEGDLVVGDEYVFAADGGLTISAMDGNWTNAGRTIANLGTVSAATSITSTAFVGPIDGIVGGNTPAAATVTTLSATGDVDLGNATSDTITCTGQFDSDLIPSTDSARDLGSSAKQWAEAHIDAGHIDQVTASLGLAATGGHVSGSGEFQMGSGWSIRDSYSCTKNGVLSIASMGADWTNASRTVADLGSITTVDINGGTINGISSLEVGSDGSGADVTFHSDTSGDYFLWDSSAKQLKIVGTSATTALDIDTGNLTVGAYGLTDGGAMTIALMTDDWTNAGNTVADLGSITTVDINGGSIDGAVIGAASQAAVSATTLSASSNLSANGTVTLQGVADAALSAGKSMVWIDEGVLKADSINDLAGIFAGTVTSTGLSDASAVLSVDITNLSIQEENLHAADEMMLYDSSIPGLRKVGLGDFVSGSLPLMSEAAMDLAADYIVFLDGGSTGQGKKEQWSDIVANLAGSGLTATNGVLSTDGAGTPNNLLDGETLTEGYNYATASAADATYFLPNNPDVGDIIRIKVGNLAAGKTATVKQDASGDNSIDGLSKVIIESPYAALSFCYHVSGSWSIF